MNKFDDDDFDGDDFDDSSSQAPLKPKKGEQVLIDVVSEQAANQLAGARVLCTSVGAGQFAAHAAQTAAVIACHHWDLYQCERTEERHADLENVAWKCDVDLPDGEFDLAAIPSAAAGDGELTRDTLQQAHQRLVLGGALWASTDNPRDTWLGEVMDELFAGRIGRFKHKQGTAYRGVKTAPLKKVKDYACEFAYRDSMAGPDAPLIKLRTRPGVFSHRKLDLGARALLEAAQVEPGMRIADIGCGSGAIAVGVALRADDIHVCAVDSAPRAVESATWAAQANGVADRVVARLNASALVDESESYDLVLMNPPYYSNHKIAKIFVESAYEALLSGGRVQLVTKGPEWFMQHLPELFENVEQSTSRTYAIVTAVKP